MIPNIGPLELAVVLIIALIVFGPKRLPEMGRSLGRGMREFRNSIGGESGDKETKGNTSVSSLEDVKDSSDR